MNNINWGPSGEAVYERTYSRVKPNGERETWPETVARVVDGNLALVPDRYHQPGERDELYNLIYDFKALPAGRHLWMSGVEGRQFLFNCYVAGWGDSLSEHFTFVFSRLIEGGGVGSNYSDKYFRTHDGSRKYPIFNLVDLHIICSPDHPDYEELKPYLSDEYNHTYRMAIEVEDSREGWTKILGQLIDCAATYRDSDIFSEMIESYVDENCGEYRPVMILDMSHVREAGRIIHAFGGTSAGPVPFAKMLQRVNSILGEMWLAEVNGPFAMDIDHAISECIVSGNVRRGARMSIMHWNDPWIDWFLKCKEGQLSHWSTNISVEIDDEFIQALNIPDSKAQRVYDAIVEGMLTNGEPGIWNSSLANVNEPNEVIATNPCGEICLESWENCNLGHVNLDSFVRSDGSVSWDSLSRAHELMTRFLIRATYGDITNEKTKEVNSRNRRIGLGHFGLAGFLAKRGIPFSEAAHDGRLENLLTEMKRIVDNEATRYSHELRIPVPVKRTTVAPTGTIAKLCGSSEGIHPFYARYYIRRIRYSKVDPGQVEAVNRYRDLGYNVVDDIYSENTWVVEIPTREQILDYMDDHHIHPSIAETVDEISLEAMLDFQALYQVYWADNSVSFTINVPKDKYSVEDVQETLKYYLPVLKGTTMMVDESRELAPYERISAVKYYELTKTVDGVTGTSFDEECASGACPVR